MATTPRPRRGRRAARLGASAFVAAAAVASFALAPMLDQNNDQDNDLGVAGAGTSLALAARLDNALE